MKIKRILMLGAFSPGSLENYYKTGFEKHDVAIETFGLADKFYAILNRSIVNKVINKLSPDFYYSQINEALLRFIEKKRYDVILVFKGMELFPDTVKQLKKHAEIIANYNPDHPFVFFFPGSGNNHVLKSIPYYDVHFSYARNIVKKLQKDFNKPAYCVPFGYDSNVALPYNDSQSAYAGRILFIGAYDKLRAKYLNKLKSSWLDIYGDDKWGSRSVLSQYLRKAYRNKSLYGNDYSSAVASSVGILNILRKQNLVEDSHNMRTFEVPGYGGVLIAERTSEQMEYFEENNEAIFFSSAEELGDKMEFLATHPDTAESIKQAAYQKSISAGYSYDHRSSQLLQCLQNHF
jgi:spore maturation protein CgeB